MIFKKKKQQNNLDAQRSATTSRQRVNSYYTATKKQINSFERATEYGPKKRSSIMVQVKTYGLRAAIVGMALFAIFAMFTLSGNASISVDGGGPYRASGQYNDIVKNALDTSLQNYIKFSLQTDKVAQTIEDAIPEAYRVAVYAPLFGRNAEIIITTAQPFAVLQQQDGSSYIVSSRGTVVMVAKDSSISTSELSTINNESGQLYTVGDQLFKPEEIASLLNLQYQYTEGKGGAVAYILPTTPREIYTKEGAYIAKFSLNDDANIVQQFGALRAVQEQLQASGRVPAEYVDVRLANKVFIK